MKCIKQIAPRHLIKASLSLLIFLAFVDAQERNVKFDFSSSPQVSVATLEELYAAVNNSANANSQIVMAAGAYVLSAMDPGGAARPNGGRLELQMGMSLIGVTGDRGAVVIDAVNLPADSYSGGVPNSGAIRLGNGNNSVEWLTIKNAVAGGAQIIVHRNDPGTSHVRVAHIDSSGGHRGIDIRNVAGSQSGFRIEAEIVDNDLHGNRISTAQGMRLVHGQGASGNSIVANLTGNRFYDNSQGLLTQSIGGTTFGVISINSNGDRFYENGGGAFIGGGFGAASNNSTRFTAVNSVFENNNHGSTGFFPGGLNVVAAPNLNAPSVGSDNSAHVVLRNCRFANNQVADLAAYGAASAPRDPAMSAANNHAIVRLYNTQIPNIVKADSDPPYPAGMNSATVTRNSVVPNFDFDGDGRADLSVFRQSERVWYINQSTAGFSSAQFGLSTDKLVPADYDGDGMTDLAIYRDGVWWWLNSSNRTVRIVQFGLGNDIPQPGDFTGDGRAEIAIYRSGEWWTLDVTNNEVSASRFGAGLDKPLVGDYDGDGKADQAVVRSYSQWHLNRSSLGYAVVNFGVDAGWAPGIVPADYDGDGKTDPAFYSDVSSDNQWVGTWYVLQSSLGLVELRFGNPEGDIAAPADYDGDGKADAAIYRNGVWWIHKSTGGISVQQFGLGGDTPVPSVYSVRMKPH